MILDINNNKVIASGRNSCPEKINKLIKHFKKIGNPIIPENAEVVFKPSKLSTYGKK